MSSRGFALIASILTLILVNVVHAAPITVTESATATGSLGGTIFSNALLTLSATGDTNDVIEGPAGFYTIDLPELAIQIVGVGSATMTGVSVLSCRNFSCLSSPPFPNAAAGFGVPGVGLDLLDIIAPEFDSYDLTTSIGPIAGAALFNQGFPFETSEGMLILNAVGSVIFTASVVPEPSIPSLWLVGLSLLLALVWRRNGSIA